MSQPSRLTRLTEAAVAKLPRGETGTRYVIYDSQIPAFGVRVYDSGRKSFLLYYRAPGGRRMRYATLGRVGIVSLDTARKHATVMLGSLANGVDPLSNRDAQRAALTVSEAARRWMIEHVREKRKPSTVRLYELAVDGHIVPRLGTLLITEINATHVTKVHQLLRATPTLANRMVAVLSSLLTWCERQNLRPEHSNPCTGRLIERYSEKAHKRYLSRAEYGRLGRALEWAQKRSQANPLALRAIRLLLLTGCRPSEIVGAPLVGGRHGSGHDSPARLQDWVSCRPLV